MTGCAGLGVDGRVRTFGVAMWLLVAIDPTLFYERPACEFCDVSVGGVQCTESSPSYDTLTCILISSSWSTCPEQEMLMPV